MDSGAASALANGQKTLRVSIRKAIEAGAILIVPTVVIAESTTGGPRDAAFNRMLKDCCVIALDERLARDAARLRHACNGASIADAIVVATADAFAKSTIVTTDPKDLKKLAATMNRSSVVSV